MKNSNKQRLKIRILLILTALAAAYVCYGIYSDTFRIWDTRVVDRLVLWRAKAGALPPGVADAVVHVDANSYFSRSQHAKVIENLTAMNVSVQLVDFLFADVTSQNEDQQLVEASRQAGNVFYGLRFESLTGQKTNNNPSSAADRTFLSDGNRWALMVEGNPQTLYTGTGIHQPYPELVAAARGIGFLNLTPDPDGIVRRLPLLASYRGTYYPSIALAAICDYFKVAPQNVIVKPGKSLTLKEARRESGASPHDIAIPIDRNGNILLDGTNYWNAVRHYSSGEIFRASENPARLAELKKELSGKIVVLSEILEKGYRTRLTDNQNLLYSGAIHTLVLQNVLAGSFLREFSELGTVLIEISMLILVFFLSMRFSSPALSLGILVIGSVYLSLSFILFVYGGVILQFTRPSLILLCAMGLLLIGLGIEKALLFAQTERARRIAERELDIGRKIQSGFFPKSLPALEGWELAAHFQAARHVAGDFYDVFTLGDDKKVGLVVADVCDKGLGAALFMALFRSSIRVLSGTAQSDGHLSIGNPTTDPEKILHKTIISLNNYISITHGDAGMFATIFYAILDPASGTLTYINGGHEPPIIIKSEGNSTNLDPTGQAVGLLPDLDFKSRTVQLEPNDVLLVYTDGVTDARSKSGDAFSKKRLQNLLKGPSPSADATIKKITSQINDHIQAEDQFDDITIMALRRCE